MNLTDAWKRLRPNDQTVKLFGGGEERDLLDARFAAPTSKEVREAVAFPSFKDELIARLSAQLLATLTRANPVPQEVVEALHWAYLTGGGEVYMEMHGRLCFCPLHGKPGLHSTACDELSGRLASLHGAGFIRGEATDAE